MRKEIDTDDYSLIHDDRFAGQWMCVALPHEANSPGSERRAGVVPSRSGRPPIGLEIEMLEAVAGGPRIGFSLSRCFFRFFIRTPARPIDFIDILYDFGSARGARCVHIAVCVEPPVIIGCVRAVRFSESPGDSVRTRPATPQACILWATHHASDVQLQDARRPQYEPSKRRITWPNGAIGTLYNAVEPDQLRGPQHDAAWCDELAKSQYAQDTWDQLQFGLRLGDNPQTCITTTRRPILLLKNIVKEPGTVIRRGSTVESTAGRGTR